MKLLVFYYGTEQGVTCDLGCFIDDPIFIGGRLYTGQYIPARTFHPAFGIFLDSHVIFHTIDEDAQES